MDISINLLPSERREEIKNLRYIGVVLKIGTMGFLALIVLASFCYACLCFIKVEEQVVEAEMGAFQQTKAYQETKQAQDALREYSKIASKVESGLKKQKAYWEVIHEINSLVPGGVTLTKFGVSEEGVVSLKGLAYTRADFLGFKEGLEKSGLLQNLKSPISNLVMEKDVDFEFTAEIK